MGSVGRGEAWLQKSSVLSDCREGAGWTKRGSASEFFIPRRRATLVWSKERTGDGIPMAEVFRLESRGS